MDRELDIDLEQTLLIVVGVQPQAEIEDRIVAYALARRIEEHWKSRHVDRLSALVCSDVWYLNQNALLIQPCVVIGHPIRNAASAFLATRIPQALAIDGSLQIQLDIELQDARACIWGNTQEETSRAVELFWSRHGEGFMRTVEEILSQPTRT